MTKGKKIWITIATVFALICIGFDAWYVTLALTAPEKLAVTTYEVGELETTDGTKKNVIEVKYFSNENHNGLEMLEICWNDYRDEDRDSFYSQGMQYVADSVDDKLSFEYVEIDKPKNDGDLLGKYDIDVMGTFQAGQGSQYYNYASDDDWVTRGISSFVPVNENSKFLIDVGEELYYLGFKGQVMKDNLYQTVRKNRQAYELFTWISTMMHPTYQCDYFYSCDPSSFAKQMYEYVQALSNGLTNYNSTVEISDFFDYYKYDGHSYTKETDESKITLVTNLFVNYYQIKFTKSADGARVASDSMFGAVAGNSAFNLTGEYSSSQYLVGRTIVNLNIDDFDFIRVDENYYALKLKSTIDDFYNTYKNDIRLSICIDLDILNSEDIEFFGFTVDSGLDKYTIFECYTLETVGGETVRTEVAV